MSETLTIPYIKPDNERTISREELNKIMAQAELDQTEKRFTESAMHMKRSLEEEGTPEAKSVLDLMEYLAPKELVAAGGQEFLISQQLKTDRRNYAVMYVVDEEQQVAARLLYKSASEGEWRVTPHTEIDEKTKGIYFSKGDKFDGGYVRETRLVDELREYLSDNEQQAISASAKDIQWLLKHFTKENLGSRDIYEDVADQTRIRMDDAVFRFVPGEGFQTYSDEPNAAEQFKKLELGEWHAPVFDTLLKTTKSKHSILGEVTTEVYPNKHGNLLWHVSKDTSGRVWLSGLTGINERANSYGASEEVLITGAFDNKPIEYKSQVQGLREGIDYLPISGNDTYVDITPLLNNLPVLQQYKASGRYNLGKTDSQAQKNPAIIDGIPEHLR